METGDKLQWKPHLTDPQGTCKMFDEPRGLSTECYVLSSPIQEGNKTFTEVVH